MRATGLVKNANSTWLEPPAVGARSCGCAGEARALRQRRQLSGRLRGDRRSCGWRGAGLRGDSGHRMRRRDRCEWGGARGAERVSGEWGHNPLPWATPGQPPGPECFCGERGCLETWISGTGLARDHERVTGRRLSGPEIVAAAAGGDAAAEASIARLEDRAGRALASVVDLLDPDVIVIGGGLSKLDRLYAHLPALIARHLFGGGELATPVLKAKHGDASGVRGAAWLWPA